MLERRPANQARSTIAGALWVVFSKMSTARDKPGVAGRDLQEQDSPRHTKFPKADAHDRSSDGKAKGRGRGASGRGAEQDSPTGPAEAAHQKQVPAVPAGFWEAKTGASTASLQSCADDGCRVAVGEEQPFFACWLPRQVISLSKLSMGAPSLGRFIVIPRASRRPWLPRPGRLGTGSSDG